MKETKLTYIEAMELCRNGWRVARKDVNFDGTIMRKKYCSTYTRLLKIGVNDYELKYKPEQEDVLADDWYLVAARD